MCNINFNAFPLPKHSLWIIIYPLFQQASMTWLVSLDAWDHVVSEKLVSQPLEDNVSQDPTGLCDYSVGWTSGVYDRNRVKCD